MLHDGEMGKYWYLGDKGLDRCILKMPKARGETSVLQVPMLRLLVIFLFTLSLSHFLRSCGGLRCLILPASDNLEAGMQYLLPLPGLVFHHNEARLGRMAAGEATLRIQALTKPLHLSVLPITSPEQGDTGKRD